ncbi:hypothetical protein CXF83_13680 [Shewanella sp. Choline-02u-19]|uniref:DUF58 domain-containing protein n=1 Tax=unclassified Shewanella TaxID=196818 RepID=UPI000C328EDB|nr:MULTISPECIES: DUF58 domain-containing protein [unclassified Shewanella]PKG73849.1 hypothetical protein CXF86_16235 [Shewanella sp. GutCb]PKH56881.1 hypothetical protein CXF84_10390 [Shewanella sp. Bg11-22]PKI27678.1 hypothetical protein CXF83_13680 [Shewanella sp. Choline-02u-19]
MILTFTAIKRQIKFRLDSWLSRRIPAAKSVTLSHKSIFILPTGFGFAWIFLFIILFLFGTNYQNNLVMGLSFLLLSMFNTCIIYSYQNLAGLTLSSTQSSTHSFAGQPSYIPILLSSKSSAFEIQLNFNGQPLEIANKVVAQSLPSRLTVQHPFRGLLRPGRLKVESRYPLGLCRAWSHVDLDIKQVIFAKPISGQDTLAYNLGAHDDQLQSGKFIAGIDEFKGLKQYVKGESLKQVAWKQWAQGRGMLTKEFQQPQGAPMWLTLDLTASNPELSLSKLAWQTEQLTNKQQIFGLKIGSNTIAPAKGEQHRIKVQTQLALFPKKYPVHSDD